MFWLNRTTGEIINDRRQSLSEFRRGAAFPAIVVTISEKLYWQLVNAELMWGLPNEERD